MITVLAEEMGIAPIMEPLPMQPGDVALTHSDVSKARRLLGYQPSTEFREGIRRFLDWFDLEEVAESSGDSYPRP